jgi:acetyl esterase/lipase
MNKYPIHKDFKKIAWVKPPIFTPLLPFMNIMSKWLFALTPKYKGIKISKKKIPGYLDHLIKVTVFERSDLEENAPCLIYFHGGGFVYQGSPHHKKMMMEYANKIPCKVIYVDYRLAPKYVFPVGVEDCYNSYLWALKNAEKLKIDSSKIALAGDSAGGAMVAAVNAMAHDRLQPKSCFQMMIYPVTDERQITESMMKYQDTPIWNAKSNAKMWKIYLKNGFGSNKGYASVSELKSFDYFPPTYIEVAEFDCLHDEGVNFHHLLKKAGVQSKLIKRNGTIHGYDILMKSDIVKQSIVERIEAFKKAFK